MTSHRSPLTILRSRSAFILIALALGAFALVSTSTAFGVVPAADGGYPGGNTAEGDNALLDLTTGANNTAIGQGALFSNTTGSNNTANGFTALFHNTLLSNTTGNHNTANGDIALLDNTTGNFNTATGARTLVNNTTGSFNIAMGINAGNNLTTVRGFGVVFTDVDQPDGTGAVAARKDSTLIDYFDRKGRLLFSSFIPAAPGDGSLSFFGIVFDDARIARVWIKTGDVAPGANDDRQYDIFMMDDFIYGEPQPLN
jgi:hypothetical protein